MSEQATEIKGSFTLKAGEEWRVEVSFENKVVIKVTDGIAEVFGTELANNRTYTFTGTKISVYSPTGATILHSSGALASDYVSDETAMPQYTNLHLYLHAMRDAARRNTARGPRVLVLGNRDTGKTSLANILCAYANKMSHQPLFVNLDPKEGAFAVPGALSATPISDIFDVETYWGDTITSNITQLHTKQPVVKWYGFEKPGENLDLYKYQAAKLSVVANLRAEQDEIVQQSGYVIDTPALGANDAALIADIIADFEVDVVVVIGNERLFVEMAKKANGKTVLKVAKSGGCVDREDVFIRAIQHRAIKEYFYGGSTVLAPYTSVIDYNDMVVYMAPEERDTDTDARLLVRVKNGAATLQNTVVAVSHVAASGGSAQDALDSAVMGFAYISDADDTKQKLKVLGPVPGRLPLHLCLIGTIRYHE
ncbi:hypothetical protein BABINDRAFT_163200 [Babjeviella inositovora NRRL Y-12698]|uniref:Polynucleotide 5'-hydroxyl-kinase GRC3 n=1 Tax=Babjeviella inositovora NRRL Y-12698 TaxID=984486 RepID=A0A1E3QL49_9ASCO|nr:uncharacterized protein BABINDRAFT_163200 [Babjeviella inositovora NRRL Y-12698]ODQ77812.1 hypothetical protein BABINDRAFT_163200 [Babjeviella inositovora NRRL Y-12698]